MKLIPSAELLMQLKSDLRQIILDLNYLKQEDPEILTSQPEPGKWSVAQVLEHLNSYGRYYLPLIESKMQASKASPSMVFSPGLLGSYFTRSMQPREGKVVNKMKAMKGHIPDSSTDSKAAIDEFESQHHHLLQLLELAATRNLDKIKIPISIAQFIRLKLGDTFAFDIAHEQRHFIQIKNTMRMLKERPENFGVRSLVGIQES